MRKALTKAERLQVYNKYDGHCAYCGKEIKIGKMRLTHFIESSFSIDADGNMTDRADDIINIIPTCQLCHSHKTGSIFTTEGYIKGEYPIEEFRKLLQAQINKMLKYGVPYKLAIAYDIIRKEEKNEVKFYFEEVEQLKETGT